MMPLFNTEERRDKVRSDRKDHKYVILNFLISSHLISPFINSVDISSELPILKVFIVQFIMDLIPWTLPTQQSLLDMEHS